MTDHFTAELFQLGSHDPQESIVFPVSRLVVDPERFDDDSKEPMAAKGMGVVYKSTSQGGALRKITADRVIALKNRFYYPHHDRLTEAVRKSLEENPRCLIIDCHSFASLPLPHEPDQQNDRPDFCIGSDSYHTPAALTQVLIRLLSGAGYSVRINSPFSGALVPALFYKQDSRVKSIMIEINRKLYMNEVSESKSRSFSAFKEKFRNILCEFCSVVARQSSIFD